MNIYYPALHLLLRESHLACELVSLCARELEVGGLGAEEARLEFLDGLFGKRHLCSNARSLLIDVRLVASFLRPPRRDATARTQRIGGLGVRTQRTRRVRRNIPSGQRVGCQKALRG